jgi:nitroimidazol reductase NimA-like FMN-containing flavoprotein (pyridoxamine 5'-phosphate oxidase superfamily)
METIVTDRNGLYVLTRDECMRLMRDATLGRVGITVDALPVILPVNFRLLGERIVFRTSPGTKLDAATRNAIVAFEVDEIEPASHSGWSVVVVGTAREVSDPDDVEELALANIPRWAPATSERVVEVSTELVTGRRIGPAPI